jgi:hypothetical protein
VTKTIGWPTRLAAALPLALLLLIVPGCGKKGPPQPPPRLIPAQTGDLTVRQTGDRLVLDLTYPAVTTSGLPLSGLEALEVLTLRPPASRAASAPANVDPRMFASTAIVAARLEGAQLLAATRGPRLVVALDAEPGSPLGPPAGGDPATTAAAAPAAAPAVAEPGVAAPTPTPTATPPGPPPLLIAIRTFGPRGNESPLSNVVAITPRAAPRPPDTLVATAAAGGVELAWTASAGAPAAGFDVLRRPSAEDSFETRVAELGPDQLQHVDATAELGNHYEYTVRAVAARGPLIESADGPVAEIEYRDTFAPPSPSGLVALAEEGRIRLLWERVEAPDLAGYRLYRQAGPGAPIELERAPGASTDHSDDQVRGGVTYTYRVTAVDHDGNESPPSEPATATPR